MKRASSCSLLLGLFWLAACKDGLGLPVVDRKREGTGEHTCESRPVRCEDVIGAPKELDVGVHDADKLPACMLGGRRSGARITGTLQHCRLTLDASMGEEIEIVDSTLESVLIQLDGRVRLRVVESEVFQSTIDDGETADPAREPLVQVHHTRLSWTQINAELLELLSSRLDTVATDVGRLSAVDIQTRDSLLLARETTISAADLNATQIGGGETLLLAGSDAINARFVAGEGVTRIYDSEITASVVDGQLESDVGTFTESRFGVDAATQLHGWFTGINNSVFCGGIEQLRYSAGAIVCSRCEGPLRRADADVCVDALVPSIEDAFNCDSLIEPLQCETFPEDARPLDF